MKKKTINPVNLKKRHIPILQALLQQGEQTEQGWHESNYYRITYKKKKIKVLLTDTIIKRESKKGGSRYEVIDSKSLGQGVFGVVYPVKATIKLAEEGLIVKQKLHGKRRIVKQRPHTTKTMDDAVNEYILTSMTPHSHAKYPVIFGHSIYSVARRMEGRELFDIINEDISGQRVLTFQERFQLSKRLIEALQTQVFDAGLVHRDLKPENIIADVDEGLVGTIDFGLAKIHESNVLNDSVGSPLYVSPEVFLGEGTTQLSDVYALGRILALLWRVDLSSYSDQLTAKQLVQFAEENDYSDLFQGIKQSLSRKAASTIKGVIEGMTAFHPKNRMDLAEALKQFNKAENLQFPTLDTIAITPQNKHSFAYGSEPSSAKEDKLDDEKLSLIKPKAKPQKKKWGFFFKSSKKEEASIIAAEKEPKKPSDHY